jgi:tetratricopeptide (TPR) repeat protein
MLKDSRILPPEERDKIKQLIRENVPLLLEFTERFTTSFGTKASKAKSVDKSEAEKLFDGIYQLIAYLSNLQNVVLIIDDLQWADDASLRLFHYLSRQVTNSSVLLIGISRIEKFDLKKNGKPTATLETLSRLRRDGLIEEIILKRLNHSESELLIDESLHKTTFSEEFYDKLFEETKGNPFFIIETLKLLNNNGIIFLEDNVWKNKNESFKIDVPNRIEDVFTRQISGLAEEEREILQLASIIGYKFDVSLLSRFLDRPKIELLKKLQQIEKELGILTSTEKSYQFEHPLLRDLLYEEISKALRTEYHSMIAHELEQTYNGEFGAVVGDIADHYYLGCEYKKAVPLLYQAGMRSFKLAAYREACRFFENLSSALQKSALAFPESLSETEYLFYFAICYEEIGNWTKCLETFQKLYEIYRIGRLHFKEGDNKSAIQCYETCLSKLDKHPVNNMYSRIYNNMGVIYFQNEDFENAKDYFTKAIESVDDEMGEFDKINAHTNLGIIANVFGKHKSALDNYKKALKVNEGMLTKISKARIYHNMGMTYSDMQEYTESISVFEKCLSFLDDRIDKQLIALTNLNMGKAHMRKGDYEIAEELTNKALKFFERINDYLSIAEGNHILGIVYGQKDDLKKAQQYLNVSLKLNRQNKYKEGLAEVYDSYANLYIKRNDLQEATKYFQKALDLFKELKMRSRQKEIQALMKKMDLEKENNHYPEEIIVN